MSKTAQSKVLLPAPAAPKIASSQQIVEVARKYGVSPFKQFQHQIRRMVGPTKTKMRSDEYYDYQLYRPELSVQEKLEFVGGASNLALNKSLSLPYFTQSYGFIQKKALFSALLEGLGLSATQTQAVAARALRFGNLPTLTSVDLIADFLRKDAKYPIFGKPSAGSKSVGSASITSFGAKDDTVTLGNGMTHPVEVIANEIYNSYADGYLLQDAVRQHDDIVALAGSAVGSVRMVTVNDGYGPKLLYAVWKIPSPAAMSDNFWQAGSMLAKINEETGVIESCIKGSGPTREDITEHPVSKKQIVGFQLPHWDAAKEHATKTHGVFPELGVLGWDMAISQDGPVIIEANSNPFHTLYQLATGRGINNPDFVPVFDAVRARQAGMKKTLRIKTSFLDRLRS